jgi:hypothetical protein
VKVTIISKRKALERRQRNKKPLLAAFEGFLIAAAQPEPTLLLVETQGAVTAAERFSD